jgi:hypothetical protein
MNDLEKENEELMTLTRADAVTNNSTDATSSTIPNSLNNLASTQSEIGSRVPSNSTE